MKPKQSCGNAEQEIITMMGKSVGFILKESAGDNLHSREGIVGTRTGLMVQVLGTVLDTCEKG